MFVLCQFGQAAQHAHGDRGVVGAIVLGRQAVGVHVRHPAHQFFPAAPADVIIAQQLAAEAGVGDVLEDDVGIGQGHVDARDFLQTQRDGAAHSRDQVRRQGI